MTHMICVPFTDLRREPVANQEILRKDPLQESQLLYGETVLVKEKKGDWVFVEAIEQPKCYPDGTWGGYKGWILHDHVFCMKQESFHKLVLADLQGKVVIHEETGKIKECHVYLGSTFFGTRFKDDLWKLTGFEKDSFISVHHVQTMARMNNTPQKKKRENMVALGKKFINSPYLWGGRSVYHSDFPRTGVDCSGLVNLLYRSQGMNIPRDAHDQFLASTPCDPNKLKPGDLIFTKNPEGKRIDHVIMYIGEGYLLEACMEPMCVRTISFEKRFDNDLNEVSHMAVVKDQQLYFGKII